MAIPKRMPGDARECIGNTTGHCQHNAITMPPADTLLDFSKWKIPLWFSSKGNALTVFYQTSPLAAIMALRMLPRFSDG